MDENSIPRFVRGVRLQHDRARERWVVLAPEKAFLPDDVAVEVLRLVDGRATLGMIVDALASRFTAPRDVIANDVRTMLHDLLARRVVAV